MATIVKRNNRSQDAIRKNLGLSTGSSGPGANTVYKQSQTPVRATSGGLAAPKGWYNESSGPGLSGIRNAATALKTNISGALGNTMANVKKTVNDYKGISSTSLSDSPGEFQRQAAPQYEDFEYDDWDAPSFRTSALTNDYLRKMQETENAKPADFQSRYEGTIQTILDGILSNGQKPFDINTDANYQALYNQYAQQYQNQANRGMRDTMGAMQAATGGYGSTAATAAAGQAYDQAMEAMNDRNLQLMQLAYQMRGDEQAERYNQLGAVTGLDNTDYARYRDNVGDWQLDRNYFADQYQRMYGNDWQKYAFDTQLDWDKYQYQTGLDWQNHQAAQNRAWDDYTFGTNMDWNQYTDAQNRAWQQKEFEYQQGRDAKSDYDDAFNLAYKMASSGQQVPAHYAAMLDQGDLDQLNALAAQMAALKLAGGSGGGGGGRRRGGGGGGDESYDYVDVATGQPYNVSNRIGLDRNFDAVARQVNARNTDAEKYAIISSAHDAGYLTEEQSNDMVKEAGINKAEAVKELRRMTSLPQTELQRTLHPTLPKKKKS